MRIVSLESYCTLDRPTVDWLVQQLIPKPGLIVLLGEAKAGKSFLALQVGLSLAQGHGLFGQPSTHRRVLFIQVDTSEAVWRDRLQKLNHYGHDIGGDIYMPHPEDLEPPINITRRSTQRQLHDLLQAASPELVIVDVLREIHQHDENSSTEMKIMGDAFMSLFGPYSTLLLHHTGKLWGDIGNINPIKACRGSSYLPGRADALWLIHDRKLKIVSRFDEERVLPVQRGEHGLWQLPTSLASCGSKKAQTVSKFDIALQLLQQHPTLSKADIYTRHADILAKQGISRPTWFRLLAGQ